MDLLMGLVFGLRRVGVSSMGLAFGRRMWLRILRDNRSVLFAIRTPFSSPPPFHPELTDVHGRTV